MRFHRLINFILVFLLLTCIKYSGQKDSKRRNNFCSQTAETGRICQSMKRFFKNTWKHENLEIDKSDPDCQQCLLEYSPVRGDDTLKSAELNKFIEASSSIICQSLNRCKRVSKHNGISFGDERCAWGPDFWCSSIESATKCQRHPHCGQEWINQRLSSDRFTPQCLTCQKTLSSIHFKGNALKSIRDKCPGSECSPLTQYVIELISLRNLSYGGVSPALLCHKLGMCEGVPVTRQSDGQDCRWAHAIWIRTRELFSQGFSDYEEVLDLLLAECDREESATDCQQSVIHFLPTFIAKYGSQLKSSRPYNGELPSIYVKACPPTDGLGSSNVCEKCERFVNDTRLSAVFSVKKLFNFVTDYVCRLTGPLETKCIVFSHDLKTTFVSLIESVLSTRAICLPFCRKYNPVKDVHFDNQFLSAELAKRLCGTDISCQEANAKLFATVLNWLADGKEEEIHSPYKEAKSSPPCVHQEVKSMCNACQLIPEDNLKILMWNAGNSSMKIEELLPQLCYMQPTEEREMCMAFVRKFRRSISRSLLELEPSGEYGRMCDLVGVCAREKQCMLCAQISGQLNIIMPDISDITPEGVNSALDQVCRSIDVNSFPKCDEFRRNFEKTITALMINHSVEPAMLCTAMGVCHFDFDLSTPSTCGICKIAVTAVEHAVARNLSQEDIVNWAKRECGILPEGYKKRCEEIVEKNLPTILKLASVLVRPELVCLELGLCSTEGDCKNLIPKEEEDYHLCSACQMSFIVTRAWIRNHDIIAKALQMSEKICRAAFGTTRAEDCVDAANSVARLVNHWLIDKYPLDFCRALHFCRENDGPAQYNMS